ncbi:MAG TPA: heavy metal-binding domain-containing protein [Rhodanobacteraceae bacterium]|nr:heavy metal-binding domain-containing protein [Rhodanobacteraceae bacterium]
MDGIIQITLFLVLLAIGVIAGRANERKHYRELAEAEEDLRDIAVSNGRIPGEAGTLFSGGTLVVGSVVIAEDFFKRVAAGLKGLVGGNLRSYETLLERGRREAIVRMKREARRLGATHVVNVRLETASLSEDWSGRRPMFSAEFIAYGTALLRVP